MAPVSVAAAPCGSALLPPAASASSHRPRKLLGLSRKLGGQASVARGARPPSARPAQVIRAVAQEPAVIPDGWTSFSSLVSGEWEGYASDFRPDGAPIQLPENAVPQAFRDWGLSLFAWQSHASTLAEPNGHISCRTKRFMPAVACDSTDPPLFSIQDEQLGISEHDAGVLAFCQDGSYAVAIPGKSVVALGGATEQNKRVVRQDTDSESVFELEHCLVAQDPEGQGRARVRVIQQFERNASSPTSIPKLVGLTLFRERWTGEYASTTDVGYTSFAEGPAVGLEAVEGRWLARKSVAMFPQESHLGPRGAIIELQPGGTEEVTRQLKEEGAVLLPQGVWSRVLPTPSGGLILKAGWLVEEDKAIVSRFDYSSSGKLEGIIISTETRISKTV